jgi:hypothetical protein
MIPQYAILEAKDGDSVCPIMIVEGEYENIVYTYDVVKISNDGVLSYTYNILKGEASGKHFENTLGDILVQMIEDKVFDDDRDEYS